MMTERKPARRFPTWAIAVVAVVAVALVAAGAFAVLGSRDQTRTLLVTLHLYNGSDPCRISLGYDDIPGAAVLVSGDGVPLATGSLGYIGSDEGLYCEFTAVLNKVPADRNIYSLTIGGGKRGTLTATRDELNSEGWTWGLTLGT